MSETGPRPAEHGGHRFVYPLEARMSRLFIRKSIQDCENDIRERGGLRRSLTRWHLTALGVGATIGAGIFATTGTAIVGDAARPGAGPAIVFSFLLTAIACGFAALSAGTTNPTTQYLASAWTGAPHIGALPVIFNLPAFAVVALLTVILVK